MAKAELLRRREKAQIERWAAAEQRGESEEFIKSLTDAELAKLSSIFDQIRFGDDIAARDAAKRKVLGLPPAPGTDAKPEPEEW